MVLLRSWLPLSLLIIASLSGCSTVMPVPSALSSPLFAPGPGDRARLAALTHELDKRALDCLEVSACEHVRFARALVSLFENQEGARASFRRVIDENPSSALAASSRLWLELIGENGIEATELNGAQPILVTLMAQLVRDWMTRELADYMKAAQPGEPPTVQQPIVEPPEAVVLRKQLRERDRQIAILQSQLESLKLIDEDHQQKQRKVKPPASLIPTGEHFR